MSDLNLKIASAGTVEDLLSIAERDSGTYKREHYVFWVKNLSKMLNKNFSAKEYGVLVGSETYSKIAQNIVSDIQNLSPTEIEVLDVLFWLRRSKFEKVPLTISEKNIQEIVEKVEEYVEKGQYKLNVLINLYYDLSLLKKQAYIVISHLLKELKNDSKSLTVQKASELLEVCSLNKNTSNFNFFSLVELIQRFLESASKNLEVEEKSRIFKNLAILELQYNPPRFRYSPLQFSLKDDLMKSFGEMSETAVINLLEAYSYLGSDYPGEMLKNLKDIIMSILSNSGDGLRTFFLITLIEKKNAFRKSFELNENDIRLIYSIIAKRIASETYFNTIKNLERVVEMYIKARIPHEELLNSIYKKVSALELKYVSIPMIDLFIKNDLDVLSLLEPYLASQKSENIPDWRLYIISSLLKDPISQNRVKKLKNEILKNQFSLVRALRAIDHSKLNNPGIEAFLNEAVDALIYHRSTMRPKEFFDGMFASCQNKAVRLRWIEYIEKNFSSLEKSETGLYFQSFFSAEEPYQLEQVILFCNGFAHFKPFNVDVKKLFEGLFENKVFYYHIKNLEDILIRFFDNFIKAIDANPKDYKIYFGLGLLKRIELMGASEKMVVKLAKGIYPYSKPQNTINLDNIIFYHFLMDNNILTGEDAKVLYKFTKQSQDKISQAITTSNVVSYILEKLPQEISNTTLLGEANQLIRTLNSRLITENDSKKSINLLCSILRFPPSLISNYQGDYLKYLGNVITSCGPIYYKEIIKILPEQYLVEYKAFYEPILDIIVKNYQEYKPKFNLRDMIFLSKRFAQLKINNPVVIKNINNFIIQALQNLEAEETFNILDSFLAEYVIYPDIIDNILLKMTDDIPSYQRYFRVATYNLFKAGYQSPIVSKFLSATNDKKINQGIQAFPSILLTIIQDFPDEVKRIEELFSKVREVEAKDLYMKRLFKFFAVVYKNKPVFRELLEKSVKKPSIFLEINESDSLAPKNAVDDLCVFLKKMNVDYNKFKAFDGITVDVYLPESDTIIKLFSKQDLSYPSHGIKGLGILTQRIYKHLKRDRSIFINIPDFFALEHPAKVDFLKSLGIKTTVQSFDFSDVNLVHSENQSKISGGQFFKGRDGSRMSASKQSKPK